MGKKKAVKKKRVLKKKRKVRVKRGQDGKIEVLVKPKSAKQLKKKKARKKSAK